MPPFYTWTHVCLAYDGLKDIYKLYINGEKRESGSWGADNRQVWVGVEAVLRIRIRPRRIQIRIRILVRI
jgi:hypothetical protein